MNFDHLVTGSAYPTSMYGKIRWDIQARRRHIRIVLDITRLAKEGKITAHKAERLRAFKRDTGSLAINVLMAFGAVAVAPGIIVPPQ